MVAGADDGEQTGDAMTLPVELGAEFGEPWVAPDSESIGQLWQIGP